MLSFEVSAIDIILVIAVVVLLILYFIKIPPINHEGNSFKQQRIIATPQKRPATTPRNDYTECPRGFGNIRTLSADNSVSEKCLGCYRIMECYSENEA